jgi:hypothetical protein
MEKLWYLRRLLKNLSEQTGLPLTSTNDSVYTAQSFVPKDLAAVSGISRQQLVKDAFLRKIHEVMGMQNARIRKIPGLLSSTECT